MRCCSRLTWWVGGAVGGRGAGDNEGSKEMKEIPGHRCRVMLYLPICMRSRNFAVSDFLPLLLSSFPPALPPGLTLHFTTVAHRGHLLARSSHLLLPVSSGPISTCLFFSRSLMVNVPSRKLYVPPLHPTSPVRIYIHASIGVLVFFFGGGILDSPLPSFLFLP